MVPKKLAVLCIVLLGAGVAIAQTDGPGDYGDECPAGTICGQNPLMTGGTWQYSDTTFVNPPYGAGRVICEKFPPPQEPAVTTPIGAISWHAAYANAEDEPNHAGCNKPHKFEIKFYPHKTTPEGQPDVLNVKATYVVIPEVARKIGVLTWSAGGESDRWLLGAVLDPPFDPALVNGAGWVSIASVQQQTLCYASIGAADEGNAKCWRYWMDNPTGGKSYDNDLHYCLGEYIPGACCDDWSGQCDEDSDQFLCDLVESRFTTGTCADLDPLCGQIPGACCKIDETCTPNMLRDACEAISLAYWRGPGTVCDDCCWIPDCPGGAYVEAEACGADLNSGCRVSPPVFEAIPENGVVCGTVWADGGDADQDWYEFTITQQANITIDNINTQIPLRLNMWFTEQHGPPNCDDLWYYVATLYDPCVPGANAMPDVFPRGTYWIRAVPEDVDGAIVDFYPCDTANKYQFDLVVDIIDCPNPCADIPGAPIIDDKEPDYCANPAPDTFNSGCDKTPPGPFLDITDDGWLYCAHSGYYELQSPICPGDLNCDDFIDFGDINPFVLALSNWDLWKTTYPDCPPENADVNSDGQYGGPQGFGDINPFVALLASGGGQPIPCFQDRDLVADTDWYKFTVPAGSAHTASIFAYGEFPMDWEIYSVAAGCGAPPMERHYVTPCLSVSEKTFCLPVGEYWLRIVPELGVECGKEYALGLEEFITCELCSVDCDPADTPEGEPCGEHLNDTCDTQAMVVPDPVWANQSVICGSTYNLLDPDDQDDDWYKFDVPAGDNQYLIVVLNPDMPLTPWMTIQGCSGSGWLTSDGIRCDPLGELNGYFVAKEDVPGGSHVDLHITTTLWNASSGWYDNPGHFPCDQTYRMIVGYSPTEPADGDFGVAKFRKLEFSAPGPNAVAKWQSE